MAFDIDYEHGLETDEARERLRALGDYLSNKHGIGVTWEGDDSARVHGKYLVVTIEGRMSLEPGVVRFSGKDPGMLWRGKAKDYLNGKLAKYMNPATAVDDLPRS